MFQSSGFEPSDELMNSVRRRFRSLEEQSPYAANLTGYIVLDRTLCDYENEGLYRVFLSIKSPVLRFSVSKESHIPERALESAFSAFQSQLEQWKKTRFDVQLAA